MCLNTAIACGRNNGRMWTKQVQQWHEEHRHFGELLGRLQKEVDLFATGERPDYSTMLEILTYLREFCDHVHHRRQDEAFARLARRVPALQLPLARLQQEHREIAQAGETLRGMLAAILDGAAAPRAEVEAAAAAYLVQYRMHLAHEEGDILDLAQATLTAEDWEAVRKAVAEP